MMDFIRRYSLRPSKKRRAGGVGSGLCVEALEARTMLSGSSTSPTTYFVAINGNDGNPGTESQPFRTISKGVSMLTPGETLLVKSGTYAESLNHIPGGTSWSSPVTIAAYPGDAVTIKPPSGARAMRALYFAGASTAYINVQGFTIDASNVTNDAIKITDTGTAGAANHIRISDCEIENSPGQGILTTNGANYNEFIGLNVHDNGGSSGFWDHGFYIATAYNLVDHCTVYNNCGYGVQVDDSDPDGGSHDNIVSNNKIYNNAVGGSYGAGILLANGPNNQAFNNVIWGNAGGIQVGSTQGINATVNNKVYNNTIYSNTRNFVHDTWGIQLYDNTVSGAVVRNNIVYGTPVGYASPGAIHDNGTVNPTIDHNLTGVDPGNVFVNAAGGDFHLVSGSQASAYNIGASPVAAPTQARASRPAT